MLQTQPCACRNMAETRTRQMERFLNPLGSSQVSVWPRARRKSLEGEAKTGRAVNIPFIQVRSATTGTGHFRLSRWRAPLHPQWKLDRLWNAVNWWPADRPRFSESTSKAIQLPSWGLSARSFFCLLHFNVRRAPQGLGYSFRQL